MYLGLPCVCLGDAAKGQHQVYCAKHMQPEQVLRRCKTVSKWMRHCSDTFLQGLACNSEASLQGSIHLPNWMNNFCLVAFLGW